MESFAKSEKPVMVTDFNLYNTESKPDLKNTTTCRKKLDFNDAFKNNKNYKKTDQFDSKSSYELCGKESIGKKNQIPRIPSNTKRNARERKRVRTINDYFSQLQRYLPCSKSITQFGSSNIPLVSTNNKKLSKVETLKAAIEYIEYLQTFSPPETQVYSKKHLNIVSASNSPFSASSSNSSILSSPASSISSSSSSINKDYKSKQSNLPPISPNSKNSFIQSPQTKTNSQSSSNAPSSIAIVANSSNVTFKATLSTSQIQQPNSATFTISSNPNTMNHREQFETSNQYPNGPYSSINSQTLNNTISNNNILNPIDFNINYNNNSYSAKDSYYYNQPYGSNYYSSEHYSQKPYQSQTEFYQSSNPSYYSNMVNSEQSITEPSIHTSYSALYPNNYSSMTSLDHGQQFCNKQPLNNETKPQYFLTTDTNNNCNIPNGNMTIEY